jgi:hypothetical protein
MSSTGIIEIGPFIDGGLPEEKTHGLCKPGTVAAEGLEPHNHSSLMACASVDEAGNYFNSNLTEL